jgi:rsbT co-antagonist protein RsbR
MATELKTKIPEVLEKQEAGILADWMKEQIAATTVRPDLLKEGELRAQSGRFLELLRVAARGNDLLNIQGPNWAPLREMLGELSRSRAIQGFTSSETATFVL